ncbi:hypothetical protein ADK43_39900 [Streptomyces rimosus subsp. rimosus]|nr:hypothetical protein ADK43_39900 [Streptomyces rimosus subsp. rimosus]
MDAYLDPDGVWIAVLGCPALLCDGPSHAAATANLHDELTRYRGKAHLLEHSDEASTPATEKDVDAALREVTAYVKNHCLDLARGRAEQAKLDVYREQLFFTSASEEFGPRLSAP